MKRFEQIDFLRGLFLIIMTIDHFESPLRRFTYQTFGFVSAAEGFVFVSGLVAGIVYSRRIEKFGFNNVKSKIISRALEIYLYHIIILLVLTFLLHNFELIRNFWKDDQLLYDQPVLGFILSAVFLYQPDHLNILPIYCVFLLLTPLAFRAILRGNLKLLVCISFGLWIAGVAGLRDLLGNALADYLPVNLGYFNMLSWQFLFFTGLIFGYLKKDNRLDALMRNNSWFMACIILGGLIFLFKYLKIYLELPLPMPFLIDKTDLGPLRLLNFAILSYIVSYLLYKYRNAGKFSPVVFLGQHSLQVFAFHVLTTIVMVPLVDQIQVQLFYDEIIDQKATKLIKMGIICIIVLTLFIPAYLHEKKTQKKHVKVT